MNHFGTKLICLGGMSARRGYGILFVKTNINFLTSMKDINKSIVINASREKVWDSMLNDEAYAKWADVFSPDGSAIVRTDWQQNSVIDFVDNANSGMRGHISQAMYPETFEIVLDGELKNGGELDTESRSSADIDWHE